ncbi:MAG: hypothetical protein A2928_04050 [Candidatus Taylorbacteria bacterium RIFCSPLOWO2_01_FULL_45_15b]|uniref:Uncharacterized protein n=1 Tax=Candidatus Taylorbacteria bacterium RIFCSPLOWO2_01_FULL_45_15b TaxID=1802319 RepID=A0A1G2NG63_9BACT|nr:MAG: hypothetical protein A2928_04050 [Candidatus Taylorbacteria bacterium RIFCSPLOWO2_01_FULL_45_15b]
MNPIKNTSIATKREIVTSFILAIFVVTFMWGFWEKGPYALGVNFTLFLGALILFFVSKLRTNSTYSKSDLAWIIPLLLMALSPALYENPFFKPFIIPGFTAVLAFFFAYSWMDKKNEIDWNVFFLVKIIGRLLSFFVYLKMLLLSFLASVFYKSESRYGMLKRIVGGVVLLLIALLIIVPILSSADPLFAEKLKPIYDFVANILGTAFIGKVIACVALATIILTSLLAWGRPNAVAESKAGKPLDLLVTSIVLGGMFIVYLLFLWVQLDRLWVGALPFDFSETEELVKSGFWQLLFLTFINIAIFLTLYRRTPSAGQKLLGAFSIASILLLVSSAHRMILYVTYYGFSYEKFYASYSVLFCAVLFVWLVTRLFVAKKSNVVKFLAFQFLWMFALVSVFPVEEFILRSNMSLVKKEGSHIRLSEMSMLSSDVYNKIKEYEAKGLLNEKIEAYSVAGENVDTNNTTYDWSKWIGEREKELSDKEWYEYNLSVLNANR